MYEVYLVEIYGNYDFHVTASESSFTPFGGSCQNSLQGLALALSHLHKDGRRLVSHAVYRREIEKPRSEFYSLVMEVVAR